MKFRLRPGARSSKYRAGQFVSAAYAARYPRLVERERPKRAAREEPRALAEPRTWEVTAVKRTRRNKHPLTIDLTFRVEVAPGLVATKESVAKAVWAWAVHGRELEAYTVHGINWRNTYRGRESEYEYDEPGEAQREAGWVLRSVGLAKVRAAPVED